MSSAGERPHKMVYFELPVKAMAWWSVFQQQLADFHKANKEISLLLNEEKTLLYIDLTSRTKYLKNEKNIPKAVLILHLVTPESVRFFLNTNAILRRPKCVKRPVYAYGHEKPAVFDTPVDVLTAEELSERLWDQRLTLAKAIEMIFTLFDDYVQCPEDENSSTNCALATNSSALASMAENVSFADALEQAIASYRNLEPIQCVDKDQTTCHECDSDADPLFYVKDGAICGFCLRQQISDQVEKGLPIHCEANARAMRANKKWTKCIRCRNQLFFDENDFGNVICPKCRVVFCVDCECKPHWPFTCKDVPGREGTIYLRIGRNIPGFIGKNLPENLSKICEEAQTLRYSSEVRRDVNRMLTTNFKKDDPNKELFEMAKTALYLSQHMLTFAWYEQFKHEAFKTTRRTAVEVIQLVKNLPSIKTLDEFTRSKTFLQTANEMLMSFCR